MAPVKIRSINRYLNYSIWTMIFQELCRDWNRKEPSEKQFEPFYRAISACAHSSGTKLKTRVQILNRVGQGHAMCLCQLVKCRRVDTLLEHRFRANF